MFEKKCEITKQRKPHLKAGEPKWELSLDKKTIKEIVVKTIAVTIHERINSVNTTEEDLSPPYIKWLQEIAEKRYDEVYPEKEEKNGKGVV